MSGCYWKGEDGEVYYEMSTEEIEKVMTLLEKEVLYGKQGEKEPKGIEIKPAWEGIKILNAKGEICECDMTGLAEKFAEAEIASDELKDALKGFEMSIDVEIERDVWEELTRVLEGGNIGERKPNRAERRNNGKNEDKSGSKFKGRRDERYGSPLYRGIPKRGRSGSKAVRSRTRNRS